MKEEIYPLLLRFYSIHNELGNIFNVSNGNNEVNYDLTGSNFSFNINIVCLGKSGSGKTTGINTLLQEYKSKENNGGCSQAKNSAFYLVKNLPIRFIEIHGYDNEYSLKKSVELLKKFRKELILYFLNNYDVRVFMSCEYSIIEEIANHFEYKIIYLITHSNPNKSKRRKIIDKINLSILGLTRNTRISQKIENLKANSNNVVFVNFHYDKYIDV